MPSRRRIGRIIAASSIAMIGLAGCTTATSQTDNTTEAPATTTTTGATGATATGATSPAVSGPQTSDAGTAAPTDGCSPEAEAAVAAAKDAPTMDIPDGPLDLDKTAESRIAFVMLYTNQWTADVAAGVTAAAEATGTTATVFDAQGSAAQASVGIEQAIAQDADGIVLLAIDPVLVTAALGDAAAQGIPVVTVNGQTLVGDVAADTVARLSPDSALVGQNAAAWVTTQSDCAADVAVVTTSLVGLFNEQTRGFEEGLTTYCGDGCRSVTLDVDLANIATDLTNQLTSTLQRDPGITQVYATFDGAVPLINPVMATTGSTAQVMGVDGVDASIEMIATGAGQDFTMAGPPPAYLGWAAFDAVSRAIQEDSQHDFTFPYRLIDGTNVGDGSFASIWPGFEGYEDAFTSAWRG